MTVTRKFGTISGAFFLVLVSSCAEMKEAGRTVGHTARNVTREIGHGVRDATREIGHGSRNAVKSIGKSAKNG